ncbi:MAG: DMT family transporter [Fimbriimonas sp.]
MPQPKRPEISWPLIVTVICWAFNFVAVKVVFLEMSPPALGLVRFLGMYALLLASCLWRKEPIWPTREDLPRAFLGGFLALGIYIVFFFEGVKGALPAEASLLVSTSPILTALLSAAFRQEPFRWQALVGGFVALLGIYLVTLATPTATGSLWAHFLLFCCALLWACSVLVLRPIVKKYPPLSSLTIAMPGALPVMLIYGFVPIQSVQWGHFSTTTWLMLGHVVVLSGFVAFVCFYAGLAKVGASGTMLYQYLVPPITAIFGWLYLGQAMVPSQIVGVATVLGGLMLARSGQTIAPSSERLEGAG